MKNEIVKINKRTAFAMEIGKGKQFKIMEKEGPQIAVLVAFNISDLSEHFSQGNTRISLGLGPFKRVGLNGLMPYRVEKADILVSNQWRRMLTLTEDTYGKHDIVFDPCDTFLNVNILGQEKGYPGCREIHADALKQWGIKCDKITNGVNLFQNTTYSENVMVTLPTDSKKDDHVIFKADMDLLISISACPCPLSESKSIHLEILT